MGKKRIKKRAGGARENRLESFKRTLISYDVVYEPVETGYSGNLPKEVEEQNEELHHLASRNPREAAQRLRSLIERYPDVPVLYNYLYVAYGTMGNDKMVKDIILQTYRRFPDYLFAKIAYMELCLSENALDEIEAILDGRYDLKLLYPERSTFHISEFTAFAGTVGFYLFRIGKGDIAERYYEVLHQMEPDHPQTRRLGKALKIHGPLATLERVRKFLSSRTGRKP